MQNADLRHSEERSDEESPREKILRFSQNDRKALFRNSPFVAPAEHNWEGQRHLNKPRIMWDATFWDQDFGVPFGHRTGIPVIQMNVAQCLGQENIDSCLEKTTSFCGTVPFGEVEKTYGKGSLVMAPEILEGHPARKLRISCDGKTQMQGISILKDARLYTIVFLTSAERAAFFPREAVYLMISTFRFLDEIKEDKKDIESLPDLMIKNIYYKGPSPAIRIEYCNTGKSSPERETFLIKVKTDSGISPGNSAYPLFVPKPGECETRGGINIERLGAKEGDVKTVTAVIDCKNTVLESNEENNILTKTLEFYPTENICEDSDGGKDFYTEGQVMIRTGNHGSGAGDCCRESLVLFQGSCVAQGPYLQEAICEHNQPTIFMYECPKGCRKGACIKGDSVGEFYGRQ